MTSVSLKFAATVFVVTMLSTVDAAAQLAPKALSDFRDKMRAGYGPIPVTQKGKQLQISLDVPRVSESAYITALSVACVHLGAQAKQVAEIAVLNKFSAQGYVYESPSQCDSIASTPIQKVRMAILGATHLY